MVVTYFDTSDVVTILQSDHNIYFVCQWETLRSGAIFGITLKQRARILPFCSGRSNLDLIKTRSDNIKWIKYVPTCAYMISSPIFRWKVDIPGIGKTLCGSSGRSAEWDVSRWEVGGDSGAQSPSSRHTSNMSWHVIITHHHMSVACQQCHCKAR